MESVIIIGAGLSGLQLAYLLKKRGVQSKIIEARSRVGGRILTKSQNGNAFIELGATWIWKHHLHLIKLIQELGINTFQQLMGDYALYHANSDMPAQLFKIPPQEPSFRIVGGTHQIMNALLAKLDSKQINLSEVAEVISVKDNYLELKTNKTQYKSNYIISTLPPKLLINKIKFEPNLPQELINIAQNTHTWMGDSIKVGLRYKKAFWKGKNKSGTIFSQEGSVMEMYDHSNFENNQFALKGFVNPLLRKTDKKTRMQLIINQLVNIFGDEAKHIDSYEETVWANEIFTFVDYEQQILPHQNNGHELFHKSYFDNRFFLAGAETSKESPGYMNAAIISAKAVFEKVIKNLDKN